MKRSAFARRLGVGLIALVVLGGGIVLVLRRSVTFEVVGGPNGDHDFEEGESIVGRPDADVALRLSEGSSLVLDAAALTRVIDTSASAPRLALDGGGARVQLRGASIALYAGPFMLAGARTQFGVRWAPQTKRLEIDLNQGTLVVSSTDDDVRVQMVAGQRLTHDGLTGDLRVTRGRGVAPAGAH